MSDDRFRSGDGDGHFEGFQNNLLSLWVRKEMSITTKTRRYRLNPLMLSLGDRFSFINDVPGHVLWNDWMSNMRLVRNCLQMTYECYTLGVKTHKSFVLSISRDGKTSLYDSVRRRTNPDQCFNHPGSRFTFTPVKQTFFISMKVPPFSSRIWFVPRKHFVPRTNYLSDVWVLWTGRRLYWNDFNRHFVLTGSSGLYH